MAKLSELVGKRIREIREAKNIKQVELAEMIDMEPTNLSKLEKGVHLPKEEKLAKITEALDIDVKDLFDFRTLKTKNALLKDINSILSHSDYREIEFFHKILTSFKDLQTFKK